MNRILISISFLVCAFSINAQTINPDGLNGSYIDKRGRYYYNKHQPAYLWISTTEDNAEDLLLESKSNKEFTNPFYFDTEGINTLRTPSQVDTSGRIIDSEELVIEVFADGKAPKSECELSGKKIYIHQQSYYKQKVKVELNSVDGITGIQKIMYSINEGEYMEYKKELYISESGDYTLKYYAVDRVGNAEKIKSVTFKIK